jgi:Protein of unknown function (DUF3455)
MTNCNTQKQRSSHGIRRMACATALGLASIVALPGAARADITPPAVPGNLKVDEGHVPFLLLHAFGTQNYVCVTRGAGVGFVLFTPQATLFNEDLEEVIHHFFSPNRDPLDLNIVRVAWQHSRDSSTFWGSVKDFSFDADFVTAGAIPWLLVERRGTAAGPAGGDKLTKTTFVHRVNTAGGAVPPEGCSSFADIGRTAFVPYEADYVFYRGPAAPREPASE